jgi:hypothetical protein
MKKVMLLGDSIRMSYQERVTELLKDKATVKGPNENCRFSSHTLFNLTGWVPDDDYDVIQWNNGLWDTRQMADGKIHTPLPHYLELQGRIASILLTKTKRLIFATTTPVWPEKKDDAVHPRGNEEIDAYNSAAVNLFADLGVETLDLNSPLAGDVKQYICDDMVHLTEAGVDRCADLVATRIES